MPSAIISKIFLMGDNSVIVDFFEGHTGYNIYIIFLKK